MYGGAGVIGGDLIERIDTSPDWVANNYRTGMAGQRIGFDVLPGKPDPAPGIMSDSVDILRVPRNLRIPKHRHVFSTEHIYVFKGCGILYLGKPEYVIKVNPMEAGDSVVIPSETIHGIMNVGNDPLIISRLVIRGLAGDVHHYE